MTLYEAVRSILAAAAPVVAIAGDRIRPDKMAEGDIVPAIVVKVGAEPENTLDGSTGAGQSKVTLFVWAESRTVADELMARAAAALHATGGVAGLGLDVWDDESDCDVDPANDGSDEHDWYTDQRSFLVLYWPDP